MKKVRKGFSRVETPLFEGMLVAVQPTEEGLVADQVLVDAAVEAHVAKDVSHNAIPSPLPHAILSPSQEPSLPPQPQQSSPQAPPQDAEFQTQLQQVLNVCSAFSKHVEKLENDNDAQKLVIIKLKARVKRLEKENMVKSSKLRRLRKVGASRRVESSANIKDVFNQGRMIDDMDMNEGIELVNDADIAKSKGRNATEHAKKQAEIYNLDLDHSSKVLSMQEDDSDDKGKGILVETPKPMKKRDQIEMDAEYARKLQEEIDRDHDGFNKDIDWDATMDHLFLLVERRYPLSRFTLEQLVNVIRLQVEEESKMSLELLRYPLSRFTLDQMLNVVRLRVEEESKMSLELLRFTRQQQQEGQLE
nr:hypothetical protein [Tanacetum cinerariifolium]